MLPVNCGSHADYQNLVVENLRKYLLANQIASDEELEAIQAEVKEAVEASVKFAEESPFPPLESAFEDIYAD